VLVLAVLLAILAKQRCCQFPTALTVVFKSLDFNLVIRHRTIVELRPCEGKSCLYPIFRRRLLGPLTPVVQATPPANAGPVTL
jgi:hypothetical protein